MVDFLVKYDSTGGPSFY